VIAHNRETAGRRFDPGLAHVSDKIMRKDKNMAARSIGHASGSNRRDLAPTGELARTALPDRRYTLKILERSCCRAGLTAGRYARRLAGTVIGSEQR
jgi:hypothetical protein